MNWFWDEMMILMYSFFEQIISVLPMFRFIVCWKSFRLVTGNFVWINSFRGKWNKSRSRLWVIDWKYTQEEQHTEIFSVWGGLEMAQQWNVWKFIENMLAVSSASTISDKITKIGILKTHFYVSRETFSAILGKIQQIKIYFGLCAKKSPELSKLHSTSPEENLWGKSFWQQFIFQ